MNKVFIIFKFSASSKVSNWRPWRLSNCLHFQYFCEIRREITNPNSATMRRRAGVGAIQKQKLESEKFKDKGTAIQDNQFEQMTKQMDFLKSNLEEFAEKHKNEIRKNPTFRRQFTEMCAAIG